uniref:Putative secreted protein n=1 Tax=Amblyomma parvum TaxID=251391 RepID=A0A023FZW9_AMBPA
MQQISLPWMLCKCVEVTLPLTICFLKSGCCLYDIPSLIPLCEANSPLHFTPIFVPRHKKNNFRMCSLS